jgi:hypothetical protein
MDGMDTRRNCAERCEPFSLNTASRLLMSLVAYFKRHSKNVFT